MPVRLTPHSGVRTLLVLGRVSNLPTVWSNCLAGWLLAGGGDPARLLGAAWGASWLYLGGTYLNDAFDVPFDRQHRRERPIPAGRIDLRTVWTLGLTWLAVGLLSLAWLSQTTMLVAVLLALTILIYDAVHNIFAFSPVFMGAARSLLILLAASTGRDGMTGFALWSALALGSYVVGLSYLARKESIRTPVQPWPCLWLAPPVVLALIVNRGPHFWQGLALGGALSIWVVYCLRDTFWTAQRNLGRSVSGLLAGIVLVDLLAVCGGTWATALMFVGLFGMTLGLQRFVPGR
ncbi:MAG: UbiA family prenyltransferase [Verrucomicrobia bacterium]|nr:UbiA family prenyltransferase [Verrucomicrobiota bacterium]